MIQSATPENYSRVHRKGRNDREGELCIKILGHPDLRTKSREHFSKPKSVWLSHFDKYQLRVQAVL